MALGSGVAPNKVIVGVQIGITSGCAVIRDGRVLFAASEERYSGIKNDTAFPVRSIEDAVRLLGLRPDDIEKVVLVSQKMSPEHFLVGRECTFSIDDYLREQYEYYRPRLIEKKTVDYLDVFADRIDSRYADLTQMIRDRAGQSRSAIWNEWRVNKVAALLGVEAERVVIMNHEMAHAAYAYYGSPFRGDDVLVVSFDGFGDDANAFVADAAGGALRGLKRYSNYNIGRVYRYITLLLAMKPSEHEYKVMGLAPYATEYNYKKALEVFRGAYQFSPDGEVVVDPALTDNFFYFKDRLESCRFDGIAGALQIFAEEMNCALVDHWLKKLSKRRVVLSGGVSLNIKANMEIGKLDGVHDLYVVGSGGDESLCIAAVYAYLDENGRGADIQPLDSLYLGDTVSEQDVEVAVRDAQANADVTVSDGGPDAVAEVLAAGKIIARVSGRMEFGARALGNRSILADPRSADVIKTINYQIKSRDFWMPFTPSMLDSAAPRYLHNPKGFAYPYMSVACETTDEGRRSLAGALHPADQTARPQIVRAEINPGYHAILSAFERKTGVGALLNTSLNLHGFPIARTAVDGVHVFKNSDLDGLVLNNTLIMRKR